jgi:hypothetical protein
LDSTATASSFVLGRGTTCSGSGTGRNCATWSKLSPSGTPTTTQASVASIAITSGAAESDFVVGESRSNFTRENQFHYTRERY